MNKQLTQRSETTILPLGYGLEAGPEAKDKQQDDKQRKEPGAGTGALVPVLSLLAIVFFLTAVMVYVLCKRRATRQSSAGNRDSSTSPPPT